MQPSTEQNVTATAQKVPPAERQASAKSRKVPNPHAQRNDILLRVYINHSMHDALCRLARYRGVKETAIGREVLQQYLMQNDPQYRAQLLNSLGPNDGTHQGE